VKPPAFEYSRPASVDEALDLLAEHGPDGKVLAGGQSLIPLLSMRLASPARLIDINSLTELAYVRAGSDGVRVGDAGQRGGQQRLPAGRRPVCQHRRVPGQRANPDPVRAGADVGQLGERIDVDQPGRAGQPHRQQRDQALPAC